MLSKLQRGIMETVILDKGTMQINLSRIRYDADECECVHRCLDEKNIPREFNGEELSLWGRVCLYKETSQLLNK